MEVFGYYDIEDMVSDVVLHVVQKSDKYDQSKARESTWVWHVAENKCKSILGHHSSKQYTAMKTVDLTVDVRDTNQSDYRRDQAKNAVERLIEFGSDEVRDFLDRLFNSKPITSIPVYEIRCLARRYSISFWDLKIVLDSVLE